MRGISKCGENGAEPSLEIYREFGVEEECIQFASWMHIRGIPVNHFENDFHD